MLRSVSVIGLIHSHLSVGVVGQIKKQVCLEVRGNLFPRRFPIMMAANTSGMDKLAAVESRWL